MSCAVVYAVLGAGAFGCGIFFDRGIIFDFTTALAGPLLYLPFFPLTLFLRLRLSCETNLSVSSLPYRVLTIGKVYFLENLSLPSCNMPELKNARTPKGMLASVVVSTCT